MDDPVQPFSNNNIDTLHKTLIKREKPTYNVGDGIYIGMFALLVNLKKNYNKYPIIYKHVWRVWGEPKAKMLTEMLLKLGYTQEDLEEFARIINEGGEDQDSTNDSKYLPS